MTPGFFSGLRFCRLEELRRAMRRPTAAVGSALFFLVGPGIMAGLVSWLPTRWQVREPVPYWAPMRVLGVMLLAAGLVVLVQAFVRFVLEGLGTPAPIAAPERLVVGGVYRYVRNPLYAARDAPVVVCSELPAPVVWVEHHPPKTTDGDTETFELVTFSSYEVREGSLPRGDAPRDRGSRLEAHLQGHGGGLGRRGGVAPTSGATARPASGCPAGSRPGGRRGGWRSSRGRSNA
jgi:hypothetical protein